MGRSKTNQSVRTEKPEVSPDERPSSLADALFTTTQKRVLSLLFGQPYRSFFASELIELTGSGSGGVQRELKRLSSSGLVSTTHIGRQKHYQANLDSPIYDELHGLVVKTIAVAEPIRRALQALSDRVQLALVYGSVAKGTDTAVSDIDLMIVADEVTLEELYRELAQVEEFLHRTINPTLYTPQEFAQRKAAGNAFLTRVLAAEHMVLLGSHDEPAAARQPRSHRSTEVRSRRRKRD